MNALADLLTSGLGRDLTYKPFALALIVYFTILGFLLGYVITRLFPAGAFSRADQTATVAIEEFKVAARELSPNLLKQVLLTTETESLIKGEDSFTDEDATDRTTSVPVTQSPKIGMDIRSNPKPGSGLRFLRFQLSMFRTPRHDAVIDLCG